MDQARLEIDQILLQFARPYSEEALPDVVSAQESTATGKGVEEATREALEKGRERAAESPEKENAAGPETGAAQTGPMSPLALDVHLVAPDNLVIRGDDIRPGGATAMQVGNVNATVGADLRDPKEPGRADHASRHGRYRSRLLRVPGASLRAGARRHRAVPRTAPAQPQPRHHRDAADPEHRRHRQHPRHRHARERRSSQLTSNPPLDEADILSLIVFNRSVNELGTGERASLAETAGGIASGFIASPLSRSIGKALDVDLFEITTSDPQTGENRRRRHARQAGERQGLRPLPSAVRPAQLHRVHAGIPARAVPAARDDRRAGNERRRQPPHPAPRRARGSGFDLFLFVLVRGLRPALSDQQVIEKVCRAPLQSCRGH